MSIRVKGLLDAVSATIVRRLGVVGGFRRDRVVWTIAGVAILVRICVAAAAVSTTGTGVVYAPDTSGYLEPAQGLLTTGQFSRGGVPEIVRTPGYPLLLLPGLWLGHVEAITVTLQALLAGLTVLAVYGLALELFHRRAAVAAASFYALEPLSILYASRLLSETMFTACLTGALLMLTRLAGRRDDPFQPLGTAAVLAGGLLSLSVLVRPVAYPVALTVGLLAAWFCLRRSAPPRQRWRPVILLTVSAIAPLLLWQGRNAVTTGYSGLSAIVDINSYFYQGAATEAAHTGTSFYEQQLQLGYRDIDVYLEANPEQRDWLPAQRFDWMGRAGLETVLEHPWTYLGIHLRGMARVAVDPGGIEYLKLFGAYPQRGGLLGRVVDDGMLATIQYVWKEHRTVLLLEALLGALLVGLYLLAVRGVMMTRPRSARAWLVCVALGGYLWFASGGPHSLSRFRHPIMPLLCVVAGTGLASRRGIS